jgi:hypothetical protein
MNEAIKRLAGVGPALLLLGVALAVRVAVFLTMHPVVHTDSVTFLFLSELDMVRTPGYPLFIELVLSLNDLLGLSADHLRVIVFGQIFILGMLNVYLLYDITRSLTHSRGFAWLMGVLYNLNFFVLGFEFQLMTETLTVTLLFAFLALYLRLFRGKRSIACLAGLIMVLLIYTRATYLLFWIFLPLITWAAFFPAAKRRRFLHAYWPAAVVFLLVCALGIGAWTLRNKIMFDYPGISSLMPYQLRYYTNALFAKYRPSGDMLQDRVAEVYSQEYKKTGPSSVTVYNFHARLNQELGLSDAQIASAFMKVQLRLIRDYPREYVRQIPASLDSYYRQYKSYWNAGNTRKFLASSDGLSVLFLRFFRFYQRLFLSAPWLLWMLVASPLLVLVLSFKDRAAFHGWLIVEAAIHYTAFVSVLSTNAGINNLRYRQPVEPLILLVFYAGFFLSARTAFRWIRRKRPEEADPSNQDRSYLISPSESEDEKKIPRLDSRRT